MISNILEIFFKHGLKITYENGVLVSKIVFSILLKVFYFLLDQLFCFLKIILPFIFFNLVVLIKCKLFALFSLVKYLARQTYVLTFFFVIGIRSFFKFSKFTIKSLIFRKLLGKKFNKSKNIKKSRLSYYKNNIKE